ncbi:MAG: AAA family ATPase, partial [Gammaproteobacteria bacterium]|nr:AAA family ATPase [Gammaproteobacteria bacterium]
VSIMTNLEKSLRHAHDRVSGVMLIVDEAQTLSPEALEELRILSNLDTRGRALMQIFLVGQSELRVTLQARRMEQLRQRIVASYHLEPLSPEETKRYIGFRLVAVGWNGDPSFSSEVYEHIYEASGGIPRKVNIVMDRLLLFGYLEEIRDFDVEHIEEVIREMSQEMSGDLVTPAPETAVETEGQPRSKSELEERLRVLESKLEDLVGAAGTG